MLLRQMIQQFYSFHLIKYFYLSKYQLGSSSGFVYIYTFSDIYKFFLLTLNILLNSIYTLFARHFGTFVIQVNYILFNIMRTYCLILISNAATKLLFQEFVSVTLSQLIHTFYKGNINLRAYFVIAL